MVRFINIIFGLLNNFKQLKHWLMLKLSWDYTLKIRAAELAKGQLLMERLFDNDVNCSIGRKALSLSRQEDHHFDGVMHLYAAYSALSEWSRDIQENVGYEVNAFWLIQLESANQHIFERIIPYFSKYDQELIYLNFPRIYAATSRSMPKHDPLGFFIVPQIDELSSFKLET